MFQYLTWICTAFSVPIGLVLAISCLCLSYNIVSLPTNVYLYEHKQLYEDWKTHYYVDITL